MGTHMGALVAAVIQLEGDSKPHASRHGIAAREWLWRWLPAELDLAAGHAPYTLSGVLYSAEGQPYLRITTLDDRLSEALLQQLPMLPEQVVFNHRTYRVCGVATNTLDHPEAGTTTYTALIRSTATMSFTQLHFHLLTPLCFHSQSDDVPFPLPRLLFHSLARRWEDFSGESLLVSLHEYLPDWVRVRSYRLNSRSHERAPNHWTVGSVGYLDLQLKKPTASADAQHIAHTLRLLATFAFYAGAGVGTTSGMGQLRVQFDL